jgi:hypothetical protein
MEHVLPTDSYYSKRVPPPHPDRNNAFIPSPQLSIASSCSSYALRRINWSRLADLNQMGRPQVWQRVPVKSLDCATYGRVVRALHHHRLPDCYLLHVKVRCRKHPDYRRDGLWAVVLGRSVIRRRRYLGKEMRQPPKRWANRAVGTYMRIANTTTAHSDADARPEKHREERVKGIIHRLRSEALQPPLRGRDPREDDFVAFLRRCYKQHFRDIDEQTVAPPITKDEVARPTELEERPSIAAVEDRRPPRLKWGIDYFSPPAHFDELPKTLRPRRQRTIAGWRRRCRSELAKARKIQLCRAKAGQGRDEVRSIPLT